MHMSLFQAKNLHHSFGDQALLEKANLSIDAGERVCLVGRNGSGKSTLLKIVAGSIKADDGEIVHSSELGIAELRQDVPESMPGSVYDCIARGIGRLADIFTEWHHAALESVTNPKALDRLQTMQDQIEANHAWNLESRISSTISRLESSALRSLSG